VRSNLHEEYKDSLISEKINRNYLFNKKDFWLDPINQYKDVFFSGKSSFVIYIDDDNSTTTSHSFLHSISSMLKAGGMLGSLFSLFAATFDIGIITLPALAAENGIGTTAILVVFGALISYFCAMLLVDCADKIGKTRYEDFAMHCWGRTASKLVGACILTSLLGFVTSYIVFVKTLIPQMLKLFIGEGSVPEFLAEGQWKGELVWGTVYVVFVMCPLSLPKNIGSLGYFSTLG